MLAGPPATEPTQARSELGFELFDLAGALAELGARRPLTDPGQGAAHCVRPVGGYPGWLIW